MILRSLIKVAEKWLGDDEAVAPPKATADAKALDDYVEMTVARTSDGLTDYERLEKKAQRFFEAIEMFEAQRDQWKQMYFESSRGHAAAQALLETELAKTRKLLKAALDEVMKARAALGAPPLTDQAKPPAAPPVGLASAYGALLKELEAQVLEPGPHTKTQAKAALEAQEDASKVYRRAIDAASRAAS